MSRPRLKPGWIRLSIQILFFVFIGSLVAHNWLVEQQLVNGLPFKDLHGICPFGAVETLGRLVLQNQFIPKTSDLNFVALAAVLLPTLLLGAVFCGWLCPLGSIQEWVGKLGKKLLKKRFNAVPPLVDRILGYGRYLVLGLIILATTNLITLVFSAYDPFYALFHFLTGQALPSATAVLAILLALSFFVERPWCRWFCPLGAVLGIVQLVSPWKIRTVSATCTACGKCSRVCPVGIDVLAHESIRDPRCIRCNKCVSACAQGNCLAFSLPRGKLRLPQALVTGILVASLFFLPIVLNQGGQALAALAQPETGTVTLEPESISSSMTLSELAAGFHADIESLIEFLALPEDTPPEARVRDFEDWVDGLTAATVRIKMEQFMKIRTDA